MLVTGRVALSVPWPSLPSGEYYWEHCFFQNTDDFTNDLQMGLQTIIDMKLLYSATVTLHGIRWYIPGTTTVYFQQIYITPQHGDQPATDDYTILQAARWQLRGPLGQRSYHLHRQPLPLSYIADGEWTTLGRSQCQIRINTFIAQGVYRTDTGVLITEGHLAERPAMWQMRHGTKRRARRAWLP